MPCSLLLALGLLSAPECYSSLAEHAALQWNPQPKPNLIFGQLSPETRKEPRPEASSESIPAVAEKPKPAESMTAETKPKACTNEMPAIAERAPRKRQPERNDVKIASPAIAQKSVQAANPVTVVAPMDLSPIALDSPNPMDHAPAIAERPPRKPQSERHDVKIASPAIAQKSVRVEAPVTEVAPIALDSPNPIDHAPAIAERLEKKANAEPNPEELQKIAQAWPTLPSHVRSEILQLVQNAE